jgi:hypothetical protein
MIPDCPRNVPRNQWLRETLSAEYCDLEKIESIFDFDQYSVSECIKKAKHQIGQAITLLGGQIPDCSICEKFQNEAGSKN